MTVTLIMIMIKVTNIIRALIINKDQVACLIEDDLENQNNKDSKKFLNKTISLMALCLLIHQNPT